MRKSLLLISLIILIESVVYSQTTDTDTIIRLDSVDLVEDTVNIAFPDTLSLKNDSIRTELEVDTTNNLLKQDSIVSKIFIDTLRTDSILLADTVSSIETYENFIGYLKDSLIFENPDTSYFIIYNLSELLKKDTILLNDTSRQAIQKLIEYSSNYDIDSVIVYIESHLFKNLQREYQDSTVEVLSDSLISAVKFLINNIPEDSLNISFTNIQNDSIEFKTAENELDSMRLSLYDNRGEYATLWIEKSDKNVFEIYLEDGIYIEKAREKKVVNQKLDTDLELPDLHEVKEVTKILPIWSFDGLADIRFNQGFISDSWSEGGESSISALSILKYSADYSYGKRRNLDTDVEYRLGYIQAGDRDLRKNDDKFEINAKYGRSAFNDWYYSALLNFKTQLLKGYEYPNDSTETNISEFLSPAYLVFSLGLDYKPSDKLTILVSPITAKFTIVADTVRFDQTRFGVGEDEYVRKEIGAYVKAISKMKVRDNINLENKLNFFTNYSESPQNIDVDWELDLKVKLTDYITMSVNAHLIYDDDVKFIDDEGGEHGARAQFKELLGVGFVYSF